MRLFAAVAVLVLLSSVAQAQQPAGSQPAPTDRTKASTSQPQTSMRRLRSCRRIVPPAVSACSRSRLTT